MPLKLKSLITFSCDLVMLRNEMFSFKAMIFKLKPATLTAQAPLVSFISTE